MPTAVRDTIEVAIACEACQKTSNKITAPAQLSQLIAPSWPLQKWGVDIVGELTTAQENYKYAIVALECFSKWIKVKPVANITAPTIKKFL